MDVEKYLKRFQFKKISPDVKEKIRQRIEKEIEETGREKIFLIDRLWNWKYAVSTATIILLLLVFNLHMKDIQRYSEEIIPAVSYKEQILDPGSEETFAFLDKNPEPSLSDYLRYTRGRRQRKGIKDYILRIEELLG